MTDRQGLPRKVAKERQWLSALSDERTARAATDAENRSAMLRLRHRIAEALGWSAYRRKPIPLRWLPPRGRHETAGEHVERVTAMLFDRQRTGDEIAEILVENRRVARD